MRMNLEAPCFQFTLADNKQEFMNLRAACRPRQFSGPNRRDRVVKWLTKVTNDSIQGPRPRSLIGIGSNEDGWNLMPQLDQRRVEFESVIAGISMSVIK